MSKTEETVIIIMLIISGVGVVAIYSSTHDASGSIYALKQCCWIALGVSLMLLTRRIHLRTLAAIALPIYLFTLLLLGLVLLIGTGPHGAKRWFDLGFMRFQPSELAKISLIMMLARYLSNVREFSLVTILKVFLLALIPALLVFREPDLGTAVVLCFIPFPLLFAAGLDGLHVLLLATPFVALVCSNVPVAGIIFVSFLVILIVFGKFRVWLVSLVLAINVGIYVIGPVVWDGLQDYQKARLLAFIKIDDHRFGAGFQTVQSKIAIGSGRIAGKGLFKGTQKALGLIPEQHTDFIFSVIGEEMGFLGSVAIIALLGLLLMRLLKLASQLRTKFSIFFCYGFTSLVALAVFVNIGMTVGLMPVTGLPLPLLSYGGSHMLMFWVACGIIFASYRRKMEY